MDLYQQGKTEVLGGKHYTVCVVWMDEYGALVGMVLTGETEVLGEKHCTVCVVDGWMGMEHLWNDPDREN